MHFTLALALIGASTQRGAAGAELGAGSPILGASSPDLGAMTAVIAVFLVCLIATAYGVRRLLGSAWRARAAKRSLSVLDVLPLGGRRQLVVVRCYDRTLALGLGDRDVSLLAELDTELVAADVAKSGEAATRAKRQFRGLLDRALRASSRVDLSSSEPIRVVAPATPPQARAAVRGDGGEPAPRAVASAAAAPLRRAAFAPLRGLPKHGVAPHEVTLPSDADEVVA